MRDPLVILPPHSAALLPERGAGLVDFGGRQSQHAVESPAEPSRASLVGLNPPPPGRSLSPSLSLPVAQRTTEQSYFAPRRRPNPTRRRQAPSSPSPVEPQGRAPRAPPPVSLLPRPFPARIGAARAFFPNGGSRTPPPFDDPPCPCFSGSTCCTVSFPVLLYILCARHFPSVPSPARASAVVEPPPPPRKRAVRSTCLRRSRRVLGQDYCAAVRRRRVKAVPPP